MEGKEKEVRDVLDDRLAVIGPGESPDTKVPVELDNITRRINASIQSPALRDRGVKLLAQRFGDDYTGYLKTAKGQPFVVQGFHILAINKKNAIKHVRRLLGTAQLGPDTTLIELREVIERIEKTKEV